eukprot:TRINITY_DN1729_c0_g1_i1.p1 TRINITY_DN1729_c0_g1~~TRINITY_DN1729_c0_g1_i1.p1  ORF type:complete len:749 (+),score=139.98 TRINITY_DN1729_c0_g1_i1:560-2806(+)
MSCAVQHLQSPTALRSVEHAGTAPPNSPGVDGVAPAAIDIASPRTDSMPVKYSRGVASMVCHRLWQSLDLNRFGKLEYRPYVFLHLRLAKVLNKDFDPTAAREEAYHKWIAACGRNGNMIDWTIFERGLLGLAQTWCGNGKSDKLYASFLEILFGHLCTEVPHGGHTLVPLTQLYPGVAVNEANVCIRYENASAYEELVSETIRDLVACLPNWRRLCHNHGIHTISDMARQTPGSLKISKEGDMYTELLTAIVAYKANCEMQSGGNSAGVPPTIVYPPLAHSTEDIQQMDLASEGSIWKSFIMKHDIKTVGDLASVKSMVVGNASRLSHLRAALTSYHIQSERELALVGADSMIDSTLLYSDHAISELLDLMPSQEIRDLFVKHEIYAVSNLDRLDDSVLARDLSPRASTYLRGVLGTFVKSRTSGFLEPVTQLWRRLRACTPVNAHAVSPTAALASASDLRPSSPSPPAPLWSGNSRYSISIGRAQRNRGVSIDSDGSEFSLSSTLSDCEGMEDEAIAGPKAMARSVSLTPSPRDMPRRPSIGSSKARKPVVSSTSVRDGKSFTTTGLSATLSMSEGRGGGGVAAKPTRALKKSTTAPRLPTVHVTPPAARSTSSQASDISRASQRVLIRQQRLSPSLLSPDDCVTTASLTPTPPKAEKATTRRLSFSSSSRLLSSLGSSFDELESEILSPTPPGTTPSTLPRGSTVNSMTSTATIASSDGTGGRSGARAGLTRHRRAWSLNIPHKD